MSKTSIPAQLRWEVYGRDDFTCQAPFCGSRRFLEVDHIVPESEGGPTALENLQTLCHKCNSQKGVRSQEWFDTARRVEWCSEELDSRIARRKRLYGTPDKIDWEREGLYYGIDLLGKVAP